MLRSAAAGDLPCSAQLHPHGVLELQLTCQVTNVATDLRISLTPLAEESKTGPFGSAHGQPLRSSKIAQSHNDRTSSHLLSKIPATQQAASLLRPEGQGFFTK